MLAITEQKYIFIGLSCSMFFVLQKTSIRLVINCDSNSEKFDDFCPDIYLWIMCLCLFFTNISTHDPIPPILNSCTIYVLDRYPKTPSLNL